MSSLFLSMLFFLVQAVFCNSLGCQPAGPVDEAPVARHVHFVVEDVPSLGDTLAGLGHAAIGLAFSGVVEVGDRSAAAASLHALAC